ncbi:hypothetical protein [Nonomuraea longicatena]|uniref:DNA polymerase III beta subunit n=1 Tax=Nonomuraea longicatena TaxID=83682 RepID=A0ABN1QYI8_9ACTN
MTTPTTTARPEITADMTGRELRAWLGAVLPHASTDTSVPFMAVVTIEAAPDRTLYALATDRYTLAVSCRPLPDPGTGTAPAPLTLTVAARALHTVIRQIKPRDTVRLTLTDDGLTLEQLGDPHLSYRLPASDYEPLLPNWRTWLTKQASQTPGPVLTDPRGVALSPGFLARFKTAARDGLPLEMRPAGRHLVVITCGTHFLGFIAAADLTGPRKTCGDPLADWLPDLAAVASGAAA